MNDCGLRTDGTCSLAGTEYCDWSCDVRDYIEQQEREFNDFENGQTSMISKLDGKDL